MRQALRHRRQQIIAAFLLGLIFAIAAGTEGVRAAEPEVRPSLGFDISWPQCGASFPNMSYGFAIIGVNGGKAYTRNRCFQEQYEWARRFEEKPAVYINLNAVDRMGLNTIVGPAGICAPTDSWCTAYNYGFNAARDAVAVARAQGADPQMWWLDVETMNRWSEDRHLNARLIGGAIEYFTQNQLETGIYSTPYQWNVIAGKYAPGLDVWTAGAEHLVDAQSRCTDRYAFGGGKVRLVQYVETFDTNWVCR